VLIVIAPHIRADHEEIEGLVVEGFHGIGKDDVEVQVVGTRSPTKFAGKAWPELPRGRATSADTKWLVEITMPARPGTDGYPMEWRYPRLKTVPTFIAHDWRERLFAVAAHEAYHVKQFRMGMRRSEVTAERWAFKQLDRMRALEAP